MIPKSGYRFSEKIMLKQKRKSGMTTRREVIALYGFVPNGIGGASLRRVTVTRRLAAR